MNEAWLPLPGADGAGRWSGPDPYLALAQASDFADHGGHGSQPTWPVSVELVDGTASWPAHEGLQLHTGHLGATHVTGRATLEALHALGGHGGVRRVQLAAPLVPRRPWPQPPGLPAAAPALTRGLKSADGEAPAPVLLGVIDDGCPFAHPALRRADGQTLRVLRLWNQDPAAASVLGAPAGFDEGAEFTRADLEALRDAFSQRGVVDAAACYAAAGLPRLRHEASHGGHVLGLLAAARAHRGGVKVPLATQGDGLAVGTAQQADIAFVQLPGTVLQSVSVPALERHAYDGLRYLCNLAASQNYRRLVVVLAYESWLGPHDGSSWFESAVDHLLDTEAGGKAPPALRGLDVQLVMPAGNSRERAVHAQVDDTGTVSWQLPPGNEDPTFLELWAPPVAGSLELCLVPPGGPPSPWLGWGQACCWVDEAGGQRAGLVLVPPGGRAGPRGHGVLRLAPSAALGRGAVAPAGTWTLHLRGDTDTLRGVHVRIARVGPGLALPRRNRQPQFVNRGPDTANADRLNTLNGHACGQRVSVAGAMLGAQFPYLDLPALDARGHPRRYQAPSVAGTGRITLRGRSAPYSGSGPTEGARLRPDASLAVEDSGLWPGVLSLGTASAATFRLSGSSAAAPLWARELADRPLHATTAAASSKPGAATAPGPATDDPALGPQLRPT